MSQANPFQPPAVDLNLPAAAIRPLAPFTPEEIADARRRLSEHCAQPHTLEVDRQLEGSQFSTATLVSGAITLVLSAAVAYGAFAAGETEAAIIMATAGTIGLVTLIFFIANLVVDFTVGRRVAATDPKRAMRRWFAAARAGKTGYALTALAPTARDRPVSAPQYGENEEVGPTFSVATREGMRDYVRSFARQGGGFVRWLQVRNVTVLREEGDIAVVGAEVTMTKWPQWAQILTIITFVVIRLVGIILGLILYYQLRKKTKFGIEKTLMKGPDGLWYLLDADMRR